MEISLNYILSYFLLKVVLLWYVSVTGSGVCGTYSGLLRLDPCCSLGIILAAMGRPERRTTGESTHR